MSSGYSRALPPDGPPFAPWIAPTEPECVYPRVDDTFDDAFFSELGPPLPLPRSNHPSFDADKMGEKNEGRSWI